MTTEVGITVATSTDAATEPATFSLGPLGLGVTGTPSYEAWAAYGGVLWTLGQATQWAVGDWIEFGERAYGEKYAQAEALSKRSPDALMTLAWVARRFPVSRRREILSWSHHAEVAGLPPAEADALLDRAEAEGLTRAEVRILRRQSRTGVALPLPLDVCLGVATVAQVRAALAAADPDAVVRVRGCRCPSVWLIT